MAPLVTQRTAEEPPQCFCVHDATCTSRSLINSYQITSWKRGAGTSTFLNPSSERSKVYSTLRGSAGKDCCSFISSTQEFKFHQRILRQVSFLFSSRTFSHKEEIKKRKKIRPATKCELIIPSCPRCFTLHAVYDKCCY